MAKRKNPTPRDILLEHLKETKNTFMKPTSDDWHPNYEGNLVKISFHEGIWKEKEYYNIVVRGADDCALIYNSEDKADFKTILAWISNLSLINKETLLQRGFIY